MPSTCVDLLREIKPNNRRYQLEKRRDNEAAWYFYLTNSGDGKSLLQLEMEYIRACHPGDLSEEPERQDTTLVILVGETFEPLLQSIYAHKPTRLVPIVNTWYGNIHDINSAADHWLSLYHLIQDLPADITGRIANLIQIREVDAVADDPSEVFRYLQAKLSEDLRNPTKRVIVDVTGAKKTMVAGAFTLAAYTKAEIFYIDAEQEDEDGRPCGYSARFRRLEGPLEKLAVHTWRQIEERYCQYDFAGALQLLEEALPEVAVPKASGLENLKCFLQICQNWEAGQLWAAHQNSERLTTIMPQAFDLIPTVVNTIWRYWPNPNNPQAELATNFFLDPGAILLYAEDELRRANRLYANGRYRSAFTRSFALLETLLKARAALLYESRQYLCEEVVRRSEDGSREADKQESDIRIDLYSHDYEELKCKWLLWLVKLSAYDLSQLLRKPKSGKLHKTGLQKWNGRRYRLWWDYQAKPEYLDNQLYLYSIANKEVPDIRNLVVHSYYPVNDPKIVEKCLTLAQKSLANFSDKWVSRDQVERTLKEARFEPPGWEAIKDSFDLSFLPEQNQPLQAAGG